MAEDAATHYNFSEYPFDHPLYSDMISKALGLFKDVLNSVPMQQFVGLRPKCYAFLCAVKVSNNVFPHTNLVEKKTASNVGRRMLTCILHTIWTHNFHTCRQNLFKSTLPTVRTVHTCKVHGGYVMIPFTLMHVVTGIHLSLSLSIFLSLSILP